MDGMGWCWYVYLVYFLHKYGDFNPNTTTSHKDHKVNPMPRHHLQWPPPLAIRVCKEHLKHTQGETKTRGTSLKANFFGEELLLVAPVKKQLKTTSGKVSCTLCM